MSTTIEAPVAALPTPIMGAPVPVRLVADWLLTPGEPGVEDPELPEEEPKDDEPGEEEPGPEELPRPDDPEEDPGEEDEEPKDELPELDEPKDDDPNDEDEPPAPFTLDCAPWPLEANPAALPRPPLEPAMPASGCPKKALTVVLASPTWISFQSALPVIGST